MQAITIKAKIKTPINKAWELYNSPEHVVKWNNASPDWHTPSASNDLRTGGTFNYRMEAKDGSFGFDFGGVYTAVELHQRVAYTMGDDRTVDVRFSENAGETEITVAFEPESQNPVDFQQQGWQAILDNFKKYAESAN